MQYSGGYCEYHGWENPGTAQSCQFHGQLVGIDPAVFETGAAEPPACKASPCGVKEYGQTTWKWCWRKAPPQRSPGLRGLFCATQRTKKSKAEGSVRCVLFSKGPTPSTAGSQTTKQLREGAATPARERELWYVPLVPRSTDSFPFLPQCLQKSFRLPSNPNLRLPLRNMGSGVESKVDAVSLPFFDLWTDQEHSEFICCGQ